MRILYISRDYSPHDHRFLAAIAASAHTPYWLRLERRGHALEERVLPERVIPVEWGGGTQEMGLAHTQARLVELQELLGRVKPDLIHAGPIQNAALMAALAGFQPLVTMSWGSDLLLDADRDRWWRWATQFTLDRSTVLFGDCKAVKSKAAEFGFPEERVVLFPWGVDLDHFHPSVDPSPGDLRARLGWQDDFVVLSNRTWEPLYGVDVLVRGFAQAACQRPELKLILLGNGSQAGLIRQILEDEGLLNRVYFGGQVNQGELPAYYQAADLYVSATYSDGSSVSLMEALASGLPVLISDIPGNLEWITPAVEGWFFPKGNAGSLARLLVEVVDQREHLPEMGQAARALAEARADWQKNSATMLQGYEFAVRCGRREVRK